MRPKLKVSDDPEKTTNPGVKKVIRFYDDKNFMRGDLIVLEQETLPAEQPIKAYHPSFSHVSKTYPSQFRREEILVPIIKAGKVVYRSPSLAEIQNKTIKNLSCLRHEHKRLQNPHIYHVSLGERLFQQKQELLKVSL